MKQPTKKAKSTAIQIKQVLIHMHKAGSINRYEAEPLGVCQLAPRIKDLEAKGLAIFRQDENNIADYHGILHDGIRRYSIDWKSMSPEATEYFKEWLK